MSLNKNNVAIVEVGGSHDECILIQLSALKKAGKTITLIATPDVIERNPHFDEYVSHTEIVCVKDQSKGSIASKVWKAIKKQKNSKAIFNTAQGGVIRNVCIKALFSKVEFIGLIHTTRKFEGSFTQKLINWKIKKYFLLSEFLNSKIETPRGITTEFFYPIRFFKSNQQELAVDKKRIAIIGGVENRRKDLEGFIKMLKGVDDNSVEFVFLGKSDATKKEVLDFTETLNREGLVNKVKLYNHFVSQDEFDLELRRSSLILPLVHPDTPSSDQYFKNQISGAMNVAFGYNVPLLIHEAYKGIIEMNSGSFYYSLNNFNTTLVTALINKEEKIKNLENDYRVEVQEKRYINFLYPS